MSAKTDYLENEILDHILGKAARNFTSPASLFLALSTADPLDDLSGMAEVGAGVGYARQSVTMGVAASGTSSNTNEITFGPCTTTNWGTITHWVLYDAAAAGNGLYHGALTASKIINVDDSLVVPVGDLDISEA